MLREYFIWPYRPSFFLQIIQYSTRIAKIHKFLLSISVYMSLPLLNHSMLSKHIKKSIYEWTCATLNQEDGKLILIFEFFFFRLKCF